MHCWLQTWNSDKAHRLSLEHPPWLLQSESLQGSCQYWHFFAFGSFLIQLCHNASRIVTRTLRMRQLSVDIEKLAPFLKPCIRDLKKYKDSGGFGESAETQKTTKIVMIGHVASLHVHVFLFFFSFFFFYYCGYMHDTCGLYSC